MTNLKSAFSILVLIGMLFSLHWISKEVGNEEYWVAETFLTKCPANKLPKGICDSAVPFIESKLNDGFISNWEWMHDLPKEYRKLYPYDLNTDYKKASLQALNSTFKATEE